MEKQGTNNRKNRKAKDNNKGKGNNNPQPKQVMPQPKQEQVTLPDAIKKRVLDLQNQRYQAQQKIAQFKQMIANAQQQVDKTTGAIEENESILHAMGIDVEAFYKEAQAAEAKAAKNQKATDNKDQGEATTKA